MRLLETESHPVIMSEETAAISDALELGLQPMDSITLGLLASRTGEVQAAVMYVNTEDAVELPVAAAFHLLNNVPEFHTRTVQGDWHFLHSNV